jgi:putative addiction module killer protein
MISSPYTLEDYITAQGKRPFKDWLEGLKDVTGRARIRVRLAKVRLGNLGDHASVGGGIEELRFQFSPGYRVYYAHEKERVILLLYGGDKASQRKDIAIAKEFWDDHKRRKKDA